MTLIPKTLLIIATLTLIFTATLISPPPTKANSFMESIAGGTALFLGGCIIGPSTDTTTIQSDQALDGEINLERTVMTLDCSNFDPNDPFGTGYTPQNTGLLGYTSHAIGKIVANPPAHTHEYIADVSQNLGLAQPAYAQGYGFASLRPILGIWKAMRNIAYVAFTLVFVFVGFAIMFRQKLNPQTVVNIQSALPKLIVTLILITFSYAIAGLLIDLMYLAVYFIILVAESFIFKDGKAMTVDWASKLGLGDGAVTVEKVALGWNVFQNTLGFIVYGPVKNASSAITDTITSAVGIDGILDIILNAIGIKGAMELLAFIIISVALLVQMWRTFFALIGAYVQIIISIIFAPLILATNALPGSTAFNKWVRNLFSNLAVFPALVAMILIALALVGENTKDGIGYNTEESSDSLWIRGDKNTGFMPPQLPGSSPEAVQGVISIGFIMLLPEVVKIVKKSLQVEDSGLGQLAMQNLQPGLKTVGAPLNPVRRIGRSTYDYATSYAGLKGLEFVGDNVPSLKKVTSGIVQHARNRQEDHMPTAGSGDNKNSQAEASTTPKKEI